MQTKPLTFKHRTVVMLDDAGQTRLSRLSARSGIPQAALIRRALDCATDDDLCRLIPDSELEPLHDTAGTIVRHEGE